MNKKHIALAALAACAFVLQAWGSPANPIERPFWGQATVTWTINMEFGMPTWSATGYETGVATHLGLYLNESSAEFDPATLSIVSAEGTVTSADGEQVLWIMTADRPGIVQVQPGGTGRFANAGGELAAVSGEDPIIAVDESSMTMTVTLTYTAAGTLIY